MNTEDIIKENTFNLSQFGDKVVVYDLNHKKRAEYTKEYLTEMWLTMSNDSFFKLFGFSWVPPLELQDKIKDKLHKQLMNNLNNSLCLNCCYGD